MGRGYHARARIGVIICSGATIGYRTTFFGSTARAPTNPPRELPHIFLTALARSVRWTGVYEPRLDAIARDGTSTIHRLHGLLRGDLAVRAADDARYAQIASPVQQSFSPHPHTHRIP